MTLVVALLAGVLILLPIVGWIAALLWAARQDGRDQRQRDAAGAGDARPGPTGPAER